jgi:hypothetical protein
MIKRVGRRHADRHSMLDEIAHSLRSADDIDFTLKTKDAEYHAGELKLRADVRIKLEPGSSMVDLKDAAEKMQEWLAEQITLQRVEG